MWLSLVRKNECHVPVVVYGKTEKSETGNQEMSMYMQNRLEITR